LIDRTFSVAHGRLSDGVLRGLPDTIRVPSYDRSALSPGIVHLGVGAFHRAHQAVFTDDCLARGEHGWGIVGTSLRSAQTRDALAPQDGLYAIAERSRGPEHLRVVGSIRRLLVAPESPPALLRTLADPRVRIVSLTITEKGYAVDPASGELLPDHPDVLHDGRNPSAPRGALGFLVEALARRKAAGVPPFTVLSCDNLPSNGTTLRNVLTAFAAMRDADLGRFVADEVACPSTMVDRIVPATTERDRAGISERLTVRDAWPVVTEPFFQWVVEDRFPMGRPGWEASGVEFVSDVLPFERMKLRMLNGAHSSIAAIGRITGMATVDEAINHPIVRSFVKGYWAEVAATLPLGLQPSDYALRLLERFQNASLAHRAEQIATDASQKLPQRILAPYRELRAAGKGTRHLVHAMAAWIRSCAGVDEARRPFPVIDPTYQAWTGKPDQEVTSPTECARAFLNWSEVFGPDINDDARLASEIATILTDYRRKGVMRVLDDFVKSTA
jgi:fructuronate reductase